MLHALPPFYHENPEIMYEMIKNSNLKFAKNKNLNISDNARDLISKVRIFLIFSFW